MLELLILISIACYIIAGYFMARFIFGPRWDEAPGSPWMCGLIWPVLLIGSWFMKGDD